MVLTFALVAGMHVFGVQAVESERRSLRNSLSVPELRRVMLDREAETTGLEAALARWQQAAEAEGSPEQRRAVIEASIRRALKRLGAAPPEKREGSQNSRRKRDAGARHNL